MIEPSFSNDKRCSQTQHTVWWWTIYNVGYEYKHRNNTQQMPQWGRGFKRKRADQ